MFGEEIWGCSVNMRDSESEKKNKYMKSEIKGVYYTEVQR